MVGHGCECQPVKSFVFLVLFIIFITLLLILSPTLLVFQVTLLPFPSIFLTLEAVSSTKCLTVFPFVPVSPKPVSTFPVKARFVRVI